MASNMEMHGIDYLQQPRNQVQLSKTRKLVSSTDDGMNLNGDLGKTRI